MLLAAACSSAGADPAFTSPGATSNTGADGSGQTTMTATGVTAGASTIVVSDAGAYAAGFDEEDLDAGEGASGATAATFTGTAATAAGSGVAVDGATVTITTAGTYRLSGTVDDGQVVVDAGSAATVRLVLAGVGRGAGSARHPATSRSTSTGATRPSTLWATASMPMARS